MSTVHIALAAVQDRAVTGATLPVAPAAERAAETLSATETSAPGALVGAEGEVWVITARDADVWVRFGPAPVAAAGAGYLILAGTTREFGADAGQKIAVRTA